jgi:outer membrane protein assembly factor BamA
LNVPGTPRAHRGDLSRRAPGRAGPAAAFRFHSRVIVLAVLLCLATGPARAQDAPAAPPPPAATDSASAPPLIVDEVLVTGNEKTEAFVILREMSLHPGDSVTQERLDYDRERIYSLRLFNRVQVRSYPSEPGKAKIVVEVNERWFIFPFPVLGIRDRDWSKVYYGAGVVHNNFRGRNEKLFGSLILGYDPAVSLFYRNTFLDDAGTWFMDARTSYSRVRNRSPEIESVVGEYQEKHFSILANVGRRIGSNNSVWLSGGYSIVHVPSGSAVATISPDGTDRFPVAGAGYMFDTRDLQEYPSRGTMLGVTFTKYGVPGRDLDYLRIAADFRHFIPLPGGLSVGARIFTDNAGGGRIPSYSRVYFGYGERIRGHFSEVIEGESLAGAAAELHVPLLAVRYLKMDLLPNGFNLWRFGVTAAVFADAGTAWFRDGSFSTANLAKGYGAGIHLLLPYSAVLRFEYALNERREGEFIVDLGAAL